MLFKEVLFTESLGYVNNPSRGFYKQISSSQIDSLLNLNKDIRLVLLEYSIVDFKKIEISKEKIDELETFLSHGSHIGVKFIFRAAYGFTSEASENDIDDIELLKIHIKQIAPILNKHSNVIYCVQAGFIGPWGEWHSSLLLKDKSKNDEVKVRNTVLKSLLCNISKDIPIGVRRPLFILNAKNSGIDISRLCIYNDGLFASYNDLGTYNDNREVEINQWNKMVSVPTNGGEMPAVSEWSNPKRVHAEMHKMKISYLNAFYNKSVLNYWNNQEYMGENSLKYIEKHLGYRFYLSRIYVPNKILKIHRLFYFLLKIELLNSGYTTIEKCYRCELIVKCNGQITKKIKIDNIYKINKINVKIKLDKTMFENGFELGIKIYDPILSNMAKHYLYNVRLANEDIKYKDGINYFYECKGYNK